MDIKLTPTQDDFCMSDAEVIAMVGGQGEGKTYAGAARFLRLASTRPRTLGPLRAVILRDTGPNIQDHTIPSILRAFGRISTIKAQRTGGWLWTAPGLWCQLFGIDDLTALSRLQGWEGDAGWLEEPAPIIDGPSAGLSEEVFTVLYGRLLSRPGKKTLQITMNPSDKRHWTYRLLASHAEADLAQYREIRSVMQVLHIPSGENPIPTPEERARMARPYAGRPDLLARYVKGEWGSVKTGEPVCPEYRESLHRSRQTLDPLPGTPCLRGWDGWHHPACVILQRRPSGQVVALDTLYEPGLGVRQLIEGHLRPLLAERYRGVTAWEDCGDQTMQTPNQSSTAVSAASEIQDLLGTTFIPIGNAERDWKARLEAMRTLLTQLVGGEGMLQLSAQENRLHEALSGDWKYFKSRSGVVSDRPVKAVDASHVGDAFSYAARHLLGEPVTTHTPTYSAKNRALSYAGRAVHA